MKEMKEKRFWRITRILCISCFQITWFFILLLFYYIPFLIVAAMRRVHIRNKMKRNLRRKGVPKHLAKELANKYQGILKQYGSVRGLWRFSKNVRKKSDPEMEDDDLSIILTKRPKSYLVSF